MVNLDRITQEHGKMGGKACIRGLRVTVSMIVGQIAAGRTHAEILAEYPYLEAEDLSQALLYAACPRLYALARLPSGRQQAKGQLRIESHLKNQRLKRF
jgi:uncharacterized protein (DUF433 family)